MNSDFHYHPTLFTERTLPLHCHYGEKEQAPILSAPMTLLCSLSSEKPFLFDRLSISAPRQLTFTYVDMENQSDFPEGRITVTKGDKTTAVAFPQQ